MKKYLNFRSLYCTAAIVLSIVLLSTSSMTYSANKTIAGRYSFIYRSQNLEDHMAAAECNPGGTSVCACSDEDVKIASFRRYGEVTSNPKLIHTFVNAIGFKKFVEILPRNEPISLNSYIYTGEIRLPVQPLDNVAQRENPEAVHLMLQLWDGREKLWKSNKRTLEASIYWDLNPWTPDYGKIKVYTKPLKLVDTGITLPPDKRWHKFTIVADLENKKYVSITVDNEIKKLQHLELAQVYHPDWGGEVALNITTESLSSWPGKQCENIFTWTTQYKNISLLSRKVGR